VRIIPDFSIEKSWIQQNLLSENVKQTIDPIVILPDG
jgi:hypothetical protein